MPGNAGGPYPGERLDGREIFECLARAGRFRDEETAHHVERMSRSCALICGQLGSTDVECEELRIASALHDIGKIGIPDAVLLKPGPLDPGERAVMERHPQIGHEILSGSADPVMALAARIALSHHERIDGTGYPNGLHGNTIPLEGRVAAVADVFDALTRDRVYRTALPVERALSILRAGRGTQFDPVVLDAFESALPDILQLLRVFPEDPSRQPPASPGRRASPIRAA